MVDQILFYEPDESHGFLSNFCQAQIKVSTQSWPTSEHYYQAQKFSDRTLQNKILTPKGIFMRVFGQAGIPRFHQLLGKLRVLQKLLTDDKRHYGEFVVIPIFTDEMLIFAA